MATDPGPKRQPSMTSMIVWVLFCAVMWAWAIIGPLYLLIGTLSFFVDWVDFPGSNTQEKLSEMRFGGGLGAVGIAFVWLRCQGYVKFADRD